LVERLATILLPNSLGQTCKQVPKLPPEPISAENSIPGGAEQNMLAQPKPNFECGALNRRGLTHRLCKVFNLAVKRQKALDFIFVWANIAP